MRCRAVDVVGVTVVTQQGPSEDRHLLITVLRLCGPVLPAATTLAFCLFGVTWPALWRDEISTWWATTLRPVDLARLLRNVDVVTAPYYVMMKAWVAIAGDSVLALRLPSALAMAGTAAVLSVLGRRLFSVGVGITAGMLFAVLPTVSRFGQEARGYAFTLLAATLATLLLVDVWERPGWLRWLGYAAAVTLLGWSHVFAGMTLLGHLAGVVAWSWRRPNRRAGAWLVAVALGALPVLPLIWLGMQQRSQVSWLPEPSWRLLLNTPAGLFGSVAVGWLIIGLALAACWPDADRSPCSPGGHCWLRRRCSPRPLSCRCSSGGICSSRCPPGVCSWRWQWLGSACGIARCTVWCQVRPWWHWR